MSPRATSSNSKAQSSCSFSNCSTLSGQLSGLKEENGFAVKKDSVFDGNLVSKDQDNLKIRENDVCHERMVKEALESDDEREEVLINSDFVLISPNINIIIYKL